MVGAVIICCVGVLIVGAQLVWGITWGNNWNDKARWKTYRRAEWPLQYWSIVAGQIAILIGVIYKVISRKF